MDNRFRRLYARRIMIGCIVLALISQWLYIHAWYYATVKDLPSPSFPTFALRLLFPTILICTGLSLLARRIGRSLRWGFMGLLSFIGVIIVLSLPQRNRSHPLSIPE